MKLKPINNEMCQVYFFEEDLEHYNISKFDDLNSNHPSFERAVLDAMNAAKDEIGFDLTGHSVEISAIPTGEKIFYLLVKKLDKPKQICCKIDDFENVISLCEILHNNNLTADLYYNGNVFYLRMYISADDDVELSYVLNEFGCIVDKDEIKNSKLISKNCTSEILSRF